MTDEDSVGYRNRKKTLLLSRSHFTFYTQNQFDMYSFSVCRDVYNDKRMVCFLSGLL